MKVSGGVIGLNKITKKLGGLEKELNAASTEVLQTAIFAIHETAIKSIQANGKGKTHTPSKPGEPPNTDTGRLVSSIKFEFIDKGRIGFVGTNLKYGAYLEFGTQNIAARPWLAPALQSVADKIGPWFEKAIGKVIKDVTS